MSEQTEAAARGAVLPHMTHGRHCQPANGGCVCESGDALNAYRTAILGSQAALVAQLTEALRVIREGDPICYVSWMNRQGYRTSPVRDYKGLYSGPQMIADVALAAYASTTAEGEASE